ncbi:N-acetylated-alpha-linked acidic dipeptidase 2-like [Rhopilema esculentum]|uniref:N-acetylated-alpha-linked acidic dipeptidase 2-like n=1 Tax=Rhopilema esculentum TaxID=499914 RepID=UPI0031DD2CC2|eukprot:gene13566-4454_t
MVTRKTVIVLVVGTLSFVVSFVVGYLVRRATYTPKCSAPSVSSAGRSMAQRQKDWDTIVKKIDASKIDANMRYLSAKPHVAASPRNNELADEIARRFKSYSFDVEKQHYNVLLSYPRKDRPNYGYIITDTNTTNFKTQYIEDILDPAENSSDALQPFNAFGLAGNATGDLVYANYGREEDFAMLKDHFKVNCTGKIVIVRYGKVYRGAKVFNAQMNGAIGIFIYNDPKNYGPVPADKTYPKSMWMPRDGVQRGSIGLGDGDILTPGWPSTDDAYRMPMDTAPGLPKIPCHPISARDAEKFLSKMGGTPVGFTNWTGGLGITYKVGPGFNSSYAGWKAKLEVHNTRDILKITNVIGTIRGATEPDRYVMVGNHRDSWVFGGVDASSGGSVLLELARVFGEYLKTGWRPARTIKFCSWGGEESGLIGSSEYVEQYVKILRDRTVAYVNIDTAVYGNYSVHLAASQLLYQTIYANLKKVKDANTAMTMFEKAVKTAPSATAKNFPRIGAVGTGSDYAHFYHYATIPVLDIMHGMQDIHSKYDGTSYYPVYHSLHDTYHWMKVFIDPKFECHRSVGEFTGRILLQYADSELVPFDPRDYATALQKGVDDIKKVFTQRAVQSNVANTTYLQKAVTAFKLAADNFTKDLAKLDKTSVLPLRIANDQLTQMEKGFLYFPAFPGRAGVRHIIFAPAEFKTYGASAFPGVTDLLYEITEVKRKPWSELQKHLTIVSSTIEGVSASLKKAW